MANDNNLSETTGKKHSKLLLLLGEVLFSLQTSEIPSLDDETINSSIKALKQLENEMLDSKFKATDGFLVPPPMIILKYLKGIQYSKEFDKQIVTLDTTIQGIASLWNQRLIGQVEARHAISTAAKRRKILAEKQRELLARCHISISQEVDEFQVLNNAVHSSVISSSIKYFQNLATMASSSHIGKWKETQDRVRFRFQAKWAVSVLSDLLATPRLDTTETFLTEKDKEVVSEVREMREGASISAEQEGKIGLISHKKFAEDTEIDEETILQEFSPMTYYSADVLTGLVINMKEIEDIVDFKPQIINVQEESAVREEGKKSQIQEEPISIFDSKKNLEIGYLIGQVRISEAKGSMNLIKLREPSSHLTQTIVNRVKTTLSGQNHLDLIRKVISELSGQVPIDLDPDMLWQLCLHEKVPLLPYEVNLGFYSLIHQENAADRDDQGRILIKSSSQEILNSLESQINLSPCLPIRSKSNDSLGRSMGVSIKMNGKIPQISLISCPVNSQGILSIFGRPDDSNSLRRFRDRVSSALELPQSHGLCPDALARYFLHYARDVPRDELATIETAYRWLKEKLNLVEIPLSFVAETSTETIIIEDIDA